MSPMKGCPEMNCIENQHKMLYVLYFTYFQPTLGTNPISLFAPAKDGDSFELDMATSSVALGKVIYILVD